MKSITIKIVFSLLLLIEFYPIEAESKCSHEVNTNITNIDFIAEGKPVEVVSEPAIAVFTESNETMNMNLNWINEGKVNLNGNKSEWEITKAMIIKGVPD